MKILYAIQGTGNGHISRARDIIPILSARGSLDILISGTQTEVSLPYPVKYRCHGLGFIFGKKGGIDFINTFLKNNTFGFISEIRKVPVEKYDLLINDFEPVTAWAAQLKKIPCIALSHQSAVLSQFAPCPDYKDPFGTFILKNYAPATSQYGFHFSSFGENIFTPLIRKEIRNINITNLGHFTVYLPSYEDAYLIRILKKLKKGKWEIFSKYCKRSYSIDNIILHPIDNEKFIQSMASSSGVLCGAGFETPAEALYLGKRLMVIPMKQQYEQQCNAAALKYLGVPVIKTLKEKHIDRIRDWMKAPQTIKVNYEDQTEKIIDTIFLKHTNSCHSPAM